MKIPLYTHDFCVCEPVILKVTRQSKSEKFKSKKKGEVFVTAARAKVIKFLHMSPDARTAPSKLYGWQTWHSKGHMNSRCQNAG